MNNNDSFDDINNGKDNVFDRKVSSNKIDISLIEKVISERDKILSSYSNLKIENNTLQKDYDNLQSKVNSLENNLKAAISKSSYAQQKLNENMTLLFSTEKKLSDITNQNVVLTHTNNLLENQISTYKTIYSDYKARCTKEISLLKTNLEEIQKEKEELMKNNTSNKRELNDYKLKNQLLEKEKETIKNDNDTLIKIIEEHNDIVKTSEAKIASFDDTIKEYKKQIDNLNLEIKKLKLENKLLKENIEKNSNYFNEKTIIYDNNFEEALNDLKNKFQKKISMKNNEYNLLKTEYINVKIERDKYYGDYAILKDDYNQNNERYQEQYLNLQKEKKEKENDLNKQIGHLNDKMTALFEENMRIKNINNDLEIKLKELIGEKDLREKLEMKNKEINEEINKIRQNNEELTQENEILQNKIKELDM